MLHLENETLRVIILDPATDRKRLGPRFCTGGYIYQVEDHRNGPLLSGPEFPVPAPSTINGQGLPEVFQFTFYNREDEIPGKKLIIGVGIVENEDGMTAAAADSLPHSRSPRIQGLHWTLEESSQ